MEKKGSRGVDAVLDLWHIRIKPLKTTLLSVLVYGTASSEIMLDFQRNVPNDPKQRVFRNMISRNVPT